MQTASTHYVTWVRRGRRGHQSGYQDISGTQSNSNVQPGDSFQPAWAPPDITWTDSNGSHTDHFAFWSITGGLHGAVIDFNDLPQPVPVGSENVTATAIYFQGGGGGNGQGVLIDAFDIDTGFVDDDFVSVSPDASLTAAANSEGWVPSASAETVLATERIQTSSFNEWHVFAGPETVDNTALGVAARNSGVAFAFYQTPAGFALTKPEKTPIYKWVPPWEKYIREFEGGLTLAEAANKVSPELKQQVMEIAAKQVSMASVKIKNEMIPAVTPTHG